MKKIIYIIIVLVLSLVFMVRYWGAHEGLPYLYHWDEVITSTSALNTLKTGDLRPNSVENVYGGFMRYSDLMIDIVHFGYLKITGVIDDTTEIKTYLDTGEFRTLSHPSFYLWNRIFAVLISIGLIYLSYLITKLVLPTNYAAQISTILVLSISQHHYHESRFTLPNVPMAFWAMFSLYFSMIFHQSKKMKHLFWALIGGGIGAATKLSGALILFFPFIVFLYNLNLHKNYANKQKILLLTSLGLTPIACFIIWTPSILYDATLWIHWNKWVLADYNDPKSGQFMKTPGLEHFSYQMQMFWEELGKFISITSILGAITLFIPKKEQSYRNQSLYIILLIGFPVLYIAYFVNNLVAYHRNFMIIYPFSAIWVGLFIGQIADYCKVVVKTSYEKYQVAFSILLVIGFAVAYKVRYETIADNGWNAYNTPDLRTKAITKLNEIKTDEIIGIAKELMFSEDDLNKLKFPYRIFEHKNIEKAALENSILIVGDYKSYAPKRHIYDDSLNQLTKKFKENFSYIGNTIFCDTDPVIRQTPHTNPTLKFLQATDYQEAKKYEIPVALNVFSKLLAWNDAYEINHKKLPIGKYKLKIKLKGSVCKDIYPHVRVYAQDKILGDFYVSKDLKDYDFVLITQKIEKLTVKIEFDNDAADGKEDRNLMIEDFEIHKAL